MLDLILTILGSVAVVLVILGVVGFIKNTTFRN